MLINQVARFNDSTVIAGSDASWGAWLSNNLMLETLSSGIRVVELVDLPTDSMRPQIEAIADHLQLDPLTFQNFHVVPNTWSVATPEELLKQVGDVTTPLMMFRAQTAFSSLNTINHWLPLAKRAVPMLENSAIITTVAWGSESMPTPRLQDYSADRLWHLRTLQRWAIKVRITDIASGKEINIKGTHLGAEKSVLFQEFALEPTDI